jgi:hypothetical protein
MAVNDPAFPQNRPDLAGPSRKARVGKETGPTEAPKSGGYTG